MKIVWILCALVNLAIVVSTKGNNGIESPLDVALFLIINSVVPLALTLAIFGIWLANH